MFPNARLSEVLALLGFVTPTSQAAGTLTSGWISVADFENIIALVSVGAFGASATVDVNFQQAQDGSGTGAKALSPAKAITQLLAAGGNNRQVMVNLRTQELDVANGFGWVNLNLIVGTAATLTSAVVLGGNPRFADASLFNPASVAQVV